MGKEPYVISRKLYERIKKMNHREMDLMDCIEEALYHTKGIGAKTKVAFKKEFLDAVEKNGIAVVQR